MGKDSRGMDPDAAEAEWTRAAVMTLKELHAATTLEEGAVEKYYQMQGLEHPEDSGDPKKPNPEYVEAAEKVKAMESVLAPLVDVAPEMFVAKPTVQAYFKHEGACLFFETATPDSGLPADDSKWTLKFHGAAADAPAPQDVPGLIHRNVAKFNECLKQLHGGAQAARSCLCIMLEEDEYTLVAEQRRGIRVDFVFALLYLADQLGVTTRAAVKVVKLGLDVLDKSTLGAWLVMGEKRQSISEAEAYALFRTGMADLAAPIPPEQPVVSLDQAKKITEYLVRTFFGHFTLYQAVYQCDAEEVKLEKKMQLETLGNKLNQKHFLCTIVGPDSSYSPFEIHICWNVLNEDRMEPPIHTEYLRSGGATTLIFMVDGAKAVNSLVIRSPIPANMVVPPESTMLL